jgi:hypothetical protein
MDDVVKVSELIRNAHQSQLQHAPPLQDMDIPMQDQEEFLNDDWELNGGGPIDELELDPPRIHLVPHADSDINQRRDCYPTAARVYGKGHTFMDVFDADRFADKRKENLYYPFASKQDWEMASWLLRSGLSKGAVDQFLHLELVSSSMRRPQYSILTSLRQITHLPLSFRTASQLRARAELLPQGPQWFAKPWKTHHPTKTPLSLYWRDPVACLESILHNPLIADHVGMVPFRLFKTAEKTMRVYTEWLSGEQAWNIQVSVIHNVFASDVLLNINLGKATAGSHHPWHHLIIRQNQYLRNDR